MRLYRISELCVKLQCFFITVHSERLDQEKYYASKLFLPLLQFVKFKNSLVDF